MKFAIVIPTFNEAANLKWLLPEIFNSYQDAYVIVVDDQSTDGTEKLIQELKVLFPQNSVELLVHEGAPSYGQSLLLGLQHAKKLDFLSVMQIDADGSHRVQDMKILLDQPGDIVIGSRYHKGSRIIAVPVNRKLISMLGNLYISILWRSKLRDKTNGFRLFRSVALDHLQEMKVNSMGFSVQIEILHYFIRRKNLNIAEVPTTFEFRRIGSSKFNLGKVLEALKFV